MPLFSTTIVNNIRDVLFQQKQTVAVAESVTSGMLQLAFSSMPDAACFYQGGITTYNLEQKTRHLHVEPLHATVVNCVSQQVATEMALQVSRSFVSDWGIGITGYATPVPASDHKLFAYYSIYFKGRELKAGYISQPGGEPFEVQQQYTSQVLDFFIIVSWTLSHKQDKQQEGY